MRYIPVLMTLLILSSFSNIAFCNVKSVEIDPSAPVQGDVITIVVKADPGEQVDVQIRFKKDLQVSSGTYFLELEGVEVPQKPNSFTVKATNVKNLVVAVRLGIWISMSKEATNGVVTISQSDVPSGRYDIQVKGDAVPGASKVTLDVTARTTITVGSDGGYSISYDTSSIPPGTFSVDVGGVSRTITLSGTGPDAPIPSLVPPLARFSFPSMPIAGEASTFDASASSDADGSVVDYVWDMGDETVHRGKVINHTYIEPGLYVVTLTVVDNSGLTGKRVEIINVGEPLNEPPVPVVTPDRVCFTNQTVGFSAYSSYDSDGHIVTYIWDFGDESEATGITVNHKYKAAGQYNASLTVADDGGLTTKTSIRVKVLVAPAGHQDWEEYRVEDGDTLSLPSQIGIIKLNSSETATYVLFFQYHDNPHPDDSLPPGQIGGIIDLSVGDPDTIMWPLYIEINYSPSMMPAGMEEKLGLYYYSSGWLQCRDTGVRPLEGVVWARLSRDELYGSPLTLGYRSLIQGLSIRGLTLSSDTVRMGDVVTVSVEVVNIGDSASLFTLVLEVDRTPSSLRTIQLGPGESRLVAFTLSPEALGLHQVGVGGVTKPLTVVSAGLPDLMVSGTIPSDVKVGNPQTIKFNVSNTGEALSEAFDVCIYINNLKIGTTRLEPLLDGETRSSMFTWTPDAPGEYKIMVLVDEANEVNEIAEDNNEFTWTVTVILARNNIQTIIIAGGIAVSISGFLLFRWRHQSSS